jgi:hypothetical protein
MDLSLAAPDSRKDELGLYCGDAACDGWVEYLRNPSPKADGFRCLILRAGMICTTR